jgi:hypothetical protein
MGFSRKSGEAADYKPMTQTSCQPRSSALADPSDYAANPRPAVFSLAELVAAGRRQARGFNCAG